MNTGIFNLNSFLRAVQSYPPWRIILEMLLIGVVVWWVVKFLQGTRGARLLRGVVLLADQSLSRGPITRRRL